MSVNFIYLAKLLHIMIGFFLMLFGTLHTRQSSLRPGKFLIAFTIIPVVAANIAIMVYIQAVRRVIQPYRVVFIRDMFLNADCKLSCAFARARLSTSFRYG